MKLPPCPYCGSPVRIIKLGGGHVCVGCEECGLGGPVARNNDEALAVAAWMHLHRKICTGCRKGLISSYLEKAKKLKERIAYLESLVEKGE